MIGYPKKPEFIGSVRLIIKTISIIIDMYNIDILKKSYNHSYPIHFLQFCV